MKSLKMTPSVMTGSECLGCLGTMFTTDLALEPADDGAVIEIHYGRNAKETFV